MKREIADYIKRDIPVSKCVFEEMLRKVQDTDA